MAIFEPRMARNSGPDRDAMSRPAKRTEPLVILPIPGKSRITASATVDLPQPNSPTSPIASPGMTFREKSITAGISPARVKKEMPRFSMSRIGSAIARLLQSRSDCSRIASASRFRPRTKDIIASAGASAGCQKMRMNGDDSLIIVPQSGLSGGMPRPK